MAILQEHHELEMSREQLVELARTHLVAEPQGPQRMHFIYRYTGHTCSWGQLTMTSLLHAIVRQSPGELVFEKGWIELPANDPGTHFMCAYQRHGHEFIDMLKQTPEFSGWTLQRIVARREPLCDMPCYCRQTFIEHKWRLFCAIILTMHGHWSRRDAA